MHNPFRYFNSSPEVIRFAVMLYVRYPLSLRQVEERLFERGIEICYETVRYWWRKWTPMIGQWGSRFKVVSAVHRYAAKVSGRIPA